jgi:hypothetical protein
MEQEGLDVIDWPPQSPDLSPIEVLALERLKIENEGTPSIPRIEPNQ